MKKTTWHFKKAGLQTLVQDNGRRDYQAFGVPKGGAMDKSAAKIANWLVGNLLDNPILEITMLGPKVEITGDCQIGITGAHLSPKINEQSIPMYETINVKDGATLSFGQLKNGCRTYLAIRGNWEVKSWLGSQSAFLLSDEKPTPDSIIQRNSKLTITTNYFTPIRKYPKNKIPTFSNKIRIRVLPGPEFEFFSLLSVGFFFSQSYEITPDSNRMGYRLNTKLRDFKPNQSIISTGIITGTIQITNAGQPIILMADAQTTGGYYRFLNVISADLDRLAQVKVGDKIWFSLVTLEEAQEALLVMLSQ